MKQNSHGEAIQSSIYVFDDGPDLFNRSFKSLIPTTVITAATPKNKRTARIKMIVQNNVAGVKESSVQVS